MEIYRVGTDCVKVTPNTKESPTPETLFTCKNNVKIPMHCTSSRHGHIHIHL